MIRTSSKGMMVTVIVVTAILLVVWRRHTPSPSVPVKDKNTLNEELCVRMNYLEKYAKMIMVKGVENNMPNFFINDQGYARDQNIRRETDPCIMNSTKRFVYNFDTDFYLLPSKAEMCAMTTGDLEKLYQMYLNTIQVICRRPIRLGNRNDGGWDLCADKQFLTPGKCRVYSFGINYDFTFDDAVAEEFNCEVHSFDPSMNQKSYKRRSEPLVYFHDIGIASKSGTIMTDKEWQMLNLKDVMAKLGHESIPDVIKLDIEFWEWDVLPDILRSRQLPKQLAIEFHLWNAKHASSKTFWLHRLWILKELYDSGYRTFWLNRNLQCSFKSNVTSNYIYACLEVSYVKIEQDIRV
ncbi:probable methyltransferase-like protein 24 [Ylistrum balloti]|uniref:probable methyltransferase-like protein 24 n=1 Tax=Ylistrum balloti TaxID=509963 RepID=UPI002905D75F|nr:probable methyltransferase-like protein 24 [Ylistrum balloti]